MTKLQEAYLELFKKVIIDYHRSSMSEYRPIRSKRTLILFSPLLKISKLFKKNQYVISEKINFNIDDRINGRDWPLYADSMVGLKRLTNVQNCLIDVIENNIPGDVIETGVWRGGTVIFMRAILKAFDVDDKTVWVADSFEGLPKPNTQLYIADENDIHYVFDELRISLEVVKSNFDKYGLLDNQVKFLKGWFKDTLPTAPIEKLSILRLDGDMYESTMDGLINLYPKLSIGGYCIVDDWGAVEGCKRAVIDYRNKFNVHEEICEIDGIGVYWKRLA